MPPKKGTKRVVINRPPINMDHMQTATIAPVDMGKYRRTRGERNEQQQAFDKLVDLAWKEWDAAGQPSDWNSIPGTWLSVLAADYETAKFMVEKAGRYYHFKITFGRLEKSTEPDDDGKPVEYVTFVFTATNYPAGETEPEAPEDDEDEDIPEEVLNSRSLELFSRRYDELTEEEQDAVVSAIREEEQAEYVPADAQ